MENPVDNVENHWSADIYNLFTTVLLCIEMCIMNVKGGYRRIICGWAWNCLVSMGEVCYNI